MWRFNWNILITNSLIDHCVQSKKNLDWTNILNQTVVGVWWCCGSRTILIFERKEKHKKLFKEAVTQIMSSMNWPIKEGVVRSLVSSYFSIFLWVGLREIKKIIFAFFCDIYPIKHAFRNCEYALQFQILKWLHLNSTFQWQFTILAPLLVKQFTFAKLCWQFKIMNWRAILFNCCGMRHNTFCFTFYSDLRK